MSSPLGGMKGWPGMPKWFAGWVGAGGVGWGCMVVSCSMGLGFAGRPLFLGGRLGLRLVSDLKIGVADASFRGRPLGRPVVVLIAEPDLFSGSLALLVLTFLAGTSASAAPSSTSVFLLPPTWFFILIGRGVLPAGSESLLRVVDRECLL